MRNDLLIKEFYGGKCEIEKLIFNALNLIFCSIEIWYENLFKF